MSLVRAAIRLSAVAALRERCWRQCMIRDSDNRPVDVALMADKDPPPYAVVFTDTDNMDSRDGRTLKMVVELGLAGVLKQSAEGPTVIIPAQTDSTFELNVDAIDRRIRSALLHDPTSKWCQILLGFSTSSEVIASTRGGQSEGGSRWAARQIVLELQPIIEPEVGVPLENIEPMMRFLEAAYADPMLATAAEFIEAEMRIDHVGISMKQAQAQLAVTERTVRSLGIAPADIVISDQTEPARVGELAFPRLPYQYSPDLYRPLRDVIEGIP
jgi:hypothetical protein